MSDIIEMKKEDFLKILHKDDRVKYRFDMTDKAKEAYRNGDTEKSIKIFKDINNNLSGPFRIGDIKDDLGKLVCFKKVKDTNSIEHNIAYIQEVKLI